MIGHPAPLAPPPPMADRQPEALIASAATSHAAIADGSETAGLQAGLTGLTSPTGATELPGSTEDQPTAQTITDAQQTADAGSAEGPKKQYSDFLTQVSDIAFGPNHEKKAGPDFTAYGKRLVETNVLPPFAIADNTPPQLKLALNTGQGQAQHMLDLLSERYRTLKA